MLRSPRGAASGSWRRCRARPIARVAAQMGVSRATAWKWVNRYRPYGEIGLYDRSSAPVRQPTATRGDTVARIESMRREKKWAASRIAEVIGKRKVWPS